MSYFSLFRDQLLGTETIYTLTLEGKGRIIMLINVSMVGILFGFSNLLGSLQTSPDLPMGGKFALITPALFSLFGMVTIFGALLGVCLVYWAASKAFGGQGGFALILDLIGVSAIPFWVMAPLLNYILNYQVSKMALVWYLLFIGAAFLWSFKLLRQSFMIGQGLPYGKATLAVAAMWIFSVSSIYVFIP